MELYLKAIVIIAALKGALCVSKAELSTFMTQIWNDDISAATDVTISLQGHTSSGVTSDHASRSFFSYVDEQYYFSRPTYDSMIRLLDNYDHNLGDAEVKTDHENVEEQHFLTELSKTSIMQQTLLFLHQNGYVDSTWSSFEAELQRIWFDFYPRRGSRYDSSGFEHVFVGEMDDTEVIGFHNWIQFYRQEKSGILDYKGYIFSKQPNVVGTHFTWMDKPKPLGSFIYGTSPEFDIAMYTVCYYTRRNQNCNFSINGDSVQVHVYDMTHGGGHHLGSAYVG